MGQPCGTPDVTGKLSVGPSVGRPTLVMARPYSRPIAVRYPCGRAMARVTRSRYSRLMEGNADAKSKSSMHGDLHATASRAGCVAWRAPEADAHRRGGRVTLSSRRPVRAAWPRRCVSGALWWRCASRGVRFASPRWARGACRARLGVSGGVVGASGTSSLPLRPRVVSSWSCWRRGPHGGEGAARVAARVRSRRNGSSCVGGAQAGPGRCGPSPPIAGVVVSPSAAHALGPWGVGRSPCVGVGGRTRWWAHRAPPRSVASSARRSPRRGQSAALFGAWLRARPAGLRRCGAWPGASSSQSRRAVVEAGRSCRGGGPRGVGVAPCVVVGGVRSRAKSSPVSRSWR